MRDTDYATRPLLLDLFAGGGGAAMGYYLAGFDVVGVDINPQLHYPAFHKTDYARHFQFIQADALTFPFDGFDVVHASPPCQRFSIASIRHRMNGKVYPDYLTPIHARLKTWGGPWVIENVVGCPILSHSITLCGLSFGLKVFRHRVFQSSQLLWAPSHTTHRGKRVGEGMFSVAGTGGKWRVWGSRPGGIPKGTAAEWREAMQIPWMTRKELTQAIPPAYTKHIGKCLL